MSSEYFFLDNFEELKNKKKSQSELLFVLNQLASSSCQIIFSVGIPFKLTEFTPALISRLQNGLAIHLKPLSVEKVVEYCTERAKVHNIELENGVAEGFYKMYPGNFTNFKQAFHKILMCLQTGSRKFTKEMLELPKEFASKRKITVSPEKILKVVGEHFQLDHLEVLYEKGGPRSLITPRSICMALMQNLLQKDTKQIGELFSS